MNRNKLRSALFCLACLLLVAWLANNPATARITKPQNDVASRVKIERIPAANVLSLPMTGSYMQHPQALTKLVKYARANYAAEGVCFGIYPIDPDTVDTVDVPFPQFQTGQAAAPKSVNNASRLVWEVGIRVLPRKPPPASTAVSAGDPFGPAASEQDLQQPLTRFAKPQAPFKLKRLPEITAATLVSDTRHTPKDGLALNVWVIENGYVQIAPTRMEYADNSPDPTKVQTRIIIPVVKRKSGLSLK